MLRRSCFVAAQPSAAYRRLVATGSMSSCMHQESALRFVDRVYADLETYSRSPKPRDTQLPTPKRAGVLSDFMISKQNAAARARGSGAAAFHPLSNIKGLYLHGGVGCGKTMLMDILYNEAPIAKKQRVHFHQFMMDVHKTMHTIRKERVQDVEPIDEAARRLIGNVELLCFDEMVVSDIADATILQRLFSSFYRIGLCCMFTSNRHPTDLYKNGLNRESFLPFIRLLEERCDIVDMQSSTDYRLKGNESDTFLSPLTSEKRDRFNALYRDLSKGMPAKTRILKVFGRDVIVDRAVEGVCRFSFAELCASQMSSADYTVIAQTFHTMFLENVPQFKGHDSDAKRRFISLIDALYEFKVKVIVLADADVFQLVDSSGGGGPSKNYALEEFGQTIDEGEGSFQMQRTISRLVEMRSTQYLRQPHVGKDPQLTDGMGSSFLI